MTRAILYVDDDAANLTVFEAAFETELTVVTARSGAEALAVLRERTDIALALLDQRMPGMTGVQLAETIRAEFPAVVRFLITAYADLSAAIDAINRGAVHRYLRKPWDHDELRAALHQGLDQHATASKLRELERRMVEVERVYALGVVAASIAHELRNPLVVVCGHVDIARSAADELLARADDDPEPDPLLARLDKSLRHAQKGAGSMRDILRGIEASTRRDGRSQSADLAELVRLTVKMLGGDAKHRTRLELELDPVPVVSGNRNALAQVVLNLLVNALQALPEGRGFDENLICVSLMSVPEGVRLRVDDNGPGVPEEARERIFDPFFTTKEQGGTGLGLAISRRIVVASGGSLTAGERPGGGARFEVVLPVAS